MIGQQTIYDQLSPGPTHGSLFSGYGGIDLALEEVFGARTVWVSDIDPGSRAVLDRRFPEAENLGDITQIPWEDVPRVDILSGGSPCQDLSAAGRRAGMTEGTRSNLWVQMREAIEELEPRLVVWENVMGALSAGATSELESIEGRVGGGSDGPVLRALGRVLGDLSEIGFDAEWATVRASDVGAPHQRARVFLIAWPREFASPSDSLRSGGWRGTEEPGQTGGDNAPIGSGAGRNRGGEDLAVDLLPTPRTSDSAGPGMHGTGGMDLRTTVSLFPTPRASDGSKGGPNQRGSKGDLTMPSAVHLLPTPKAADGEFGLPRTSGRPPEKSTHLATRLHFTDYGDYTPAIERWEHTTGRLAPAPTKPSPRTGKPQLSSALVEWMMGLPDGWFTDPELGLTRVQQLQLGGNGVVPQQAAYTVGALLERSSMKEAS